MCPIGLARATKPLSNLDRLLRGRWHWNSKHAQDDMSEKPWIHHQQNVKQACWHARDNMQLATECIGSHTFFFANSCRKFKLCPSEHQTQWVGPIRLTPMRHDEHILFDIIDHHTTAKKRLSCLKWDIAAFGSHARIKKQDVSKNLNAHHSSCLCHHTMSWGFFLSVVSLEQKKLQNKERKVHCQSIFVKLRSAEFENLTVWVLVSKWSCKDVHADTNTNRNFGIAFAHYLTNVMWWPFVQISECCRLVSVLVLCPFSVEPMKFAFQTVWQWVSKKHEVCSREWVMTNTDIILIGFVQFELRHSLQS